MRFDESYAGVGKLLRSPAMVQEMRHRAEQIASAARATAPFDPADKDGVHFKESFKVTSGVRRTPTRRAFGRVTNVDPHAVHIEFGTSDTPAHHTMGRAIDAARN